MEHFNAGTLDGEPVNFLRTVHGPGGRVRDGERQRVAISQRRSSYGKDTLDQLFSAASRAGRSTIRSRSSTPRRRPRRRSTRSTSTSEHIADVHERQAADPRARRRPGLLTKGNGKYEWRGFLGQEQAHPRHRSARRDDHELEQHLRARVRRRGRQLGQQRLRGARRPARLQPRPPEAKREVVARVGDRGDERRRDPGRARDRHGAAAAEAAQGLGARPSPQAEQMLALLGAWRANGGSRLDRDLDGLIDDPGRRSWTPRGRGSRTLSWAAADAWRSSTSSTLFRRWDAPPVVSTTAGTSTSTATSARCSASASRPFENSYCGKGKLGGRARTRSGRRSRRPASS